MTPEVDAQVAALNKIVSEATYPPGLEGHEVTFERGLFQFYGPIMGKSFRSYEEADDFIRMLVTP